MIWVAGLLAASAILVGLLIVYIDVVGARYCHGSCAAMAFIQ
jgi:hypothetical protein